MLFLNTHYFKDSYYNVPPEKVKDYTAASSAFMEKYFKSGKCKARYWFANGSGGIAIWDFDSTEEAYTILHESPAFPFIESELVPIFDYQGLTKIRNQRETASKTTQK
jgi:muconolactone D-isomerase